MTYNFYIDPITRKITAEKMVVLREDQRVNSIHFIVEDFEGFSFDQASIRIKVIMPDKEQIEIVPENVTVEPVITIGDEGEEVITTYATSFDWTLTKEHTRQIGTIMYSICAKILEDGAVEKEWHSLNDSFQVHDHIHFTD